MSPDCPKRRVTVEISEDLHRRIKTACWTSGKTISQAVRADLERIYGNRKFVIDKPRREKVAA